MMCCARFRAIEVTQVIGAGVRVSPLRPCEEALQDQLTDEPRSAAPIGLGVGPGRERGVVPLLWPFLEDDDRVCEAAAIALMRLGEDRPLHRAHAGGRVALLGTTCARDRRRFQIRTGAASKSARRYERGRGR